jgi:GcrA cell cycle regulator
MNVRVTVSDADLAQAQSERGWTETRTRVATALFNSGLSAAQVACEIGGASRNAVIGKLHRAEAVDAGRTLPRGSNGKATGIRQRPQRVRPPPGARISQPRQFSADGPPPPHVDDESIPVEQRRSLAQLNDECCHWPVGDPIQPGFFFCGAVVHQPDRNRLRPYCPSHMRRARDYVRASRPRADVQRGVADAWR